MKAIITGLNGTVAPVVAKRLNSEDIQVIPWNRKKVSISDAGQMQNFIKSTHPEWFLHIATGPVDWAEAVAKICYRNDVKFLFTSSVSVFDNRTRGPYTINDQPDATDDYGSYKIECEKRVRSENPDALIARLGWQIGEKTGSNNMLDFLFKEAKDNGEIAASKDWIPSCSFLEDTADGIFQLMIKAVPGMYHLEGNPGLSFIEIVRRLNRLHRQKWVITEDNRPNRDNRLASAPQLVGSIIKRLPD